MTIQRLHHVQFVVPTPQENSARAFYLDVLGLQEIPKPASLVARGGFWILLGDIQIHVSLSDSFDARQSPAHLAFQVDNLEHWREILTEKGIVIDQSIPIEGYDRFEFRDPFGNRVEMIQAIEESL